MTIPNVDELNKNFSIDNGNHALHFNIGEGDIPVVKIQNEQASATISLQGAHLLSWIPVGQEEVIWVSDDATFAAAKSVRGGVPICWPWFGPHENNAAFPAHGFARTVLWEVINTEKLLAGETQITFRLETNELDDSQINKGGEHMWPTATLAEYTLTIGKSLTMELNTFNNSDQPITIGQALHTYFNVDDVTNTSVSGLEGKDYLDKTDNFVRKTQTGSVIINSEVDRIYLQTSDDVIIDDKKRKIIIKKLGSQSTVVWNPWKAVAEKMGDLGKDGYLKMLCVESANAAEDTININAGESHKLVVIYEIDGI